jgi:hypothetical protein
MLIDSEQKRSRGIRIVNTPNRDSDIFGLRTRTDLNLSGYEYKQRLIETSERNIDKKLRVTKS